MFLRLLLRLTVAVTFGCHLSLPAIGADERLISLQEDAQSASPDSLLRQPILFRVVDGHDRAVAGIEIEFRIKSGDGRLLSRDDFTQGRETVLVSTDKEGFAEVFFRAPSVPHKTTLIAVNAALESREMERELSVTTVDNSGLPTEPSQPRVESSETDSAAFVVSWGGSPTDTAYYSVARSEDGETWTTIAVVPPQITRIVDRVPDNSRGYIYRITASN